MKTNVLNYRIIIRPDTQTGTGKMGFTAHCPTLGVADVGDTIDDALNNIKNAIKIYIQSLVEDHQKFPVDEPEYDVVTTAQIDIPSGFHYA